VHPAAPDGGRTMAAGQARAKCGEPEAEESRTEVGLGEESRIEVGPGEESRTAREVHRIAEPFLRWFDLAWTRTGGEMGDGLLWRLELKERG